MASYREIVTKTVLGKAKKTFTNSYSLKPENTPSTVLGCWVINHNFNGTKEKDKIRLKGTSDINIWYSYDNDTKTEVSKGTISYDELVSVLKRRESNISDNSEIIVRSLKEPTCTKVEIVDGKIYYDIEKTLGVEIVGDAKVRIAVDEDEDDWEEIKDEEVKEEVMDEIDKEVDENFINEKENL